MKKSLYCYISSGGIVVPQSLDESEAGDVLCSLLSDKAFVLPFTTNAENSKEALDIYNERIKDNLNMFEILIGKESLHIK